MEQTEGEALQASVLRGLLARLEMDVGFGVEFTGNDSAGIAGLGKQLAVLRTGSSGSAASSSSSTRSTAPLSDSGSLPGDTFREVGGGQPGGSTRVREQRGNAAGDTSFSSSSSKTQSSSPARERDPEPEWDIPPPPVIHVRTSLVPFVESPSRPEKESALAELREECMRCELCGLCERRHSVVWGEGDLSSAVMFIGEGPGRDEDAEGRPFVGRSGRLLTDIIEKGMKTPRSGVYIANVVKCRPPGNRDPYPDEVAACARYLDRQIAVISPKVIVAVGSVAGRTLLRRESSGGLRGAWHEYSGIPLRVIYHPSYLLRMRRTENDRTQADRIVWQDIQEVMARLQ